MIQWSRTQAFAATFISETRLAKAFRTHVLRNFPRCIQILLTNVPKNIVPANQVNLQPKETA